MEAVPTVLSESGKKFNTLVKRREKFLQQDAGLLANSKLLTKVLYDVTKLIEEVSSPQTLPELLIEGFDTEQVWAGVELQNRQRLPDIEAQLAAFDPAKLAAAPLLLGKQAQNKPLKVSGPSVDYDEDDDPEDIASLKDNDSDVENEEKKDDSDILNDPDFQNMSDSDGDDLPLFGNLSDDELEDEDDDKAKGTFKERERKGGGRVTEVDDQFFKLSDMEQFLDTEDQKEMRKNDENKQEDDDDGEGLDLFEGGDDGGDEKIMYKEYFEAEQQEDGEESNEEEEKEGEHKSGSGEEDEEEEEEEEKEEKSMSKRRLLSDDEDDDTEAVTKSSHEVAQERLAKKISHLEEAAVAAQRWQMSGEVAAPSREENSLLAEHLDYDTAVRHAPVVTEDVARKLEDIIRQRVKDKAWDDVERKVRPVEDPAEYRKKLVLDQEKSKLSLAQVYEEEYVKLAEAANTAKSRTVGPGLLDKEEEEETPAAVEDIRSAMTALFRKLDSLSHLHYTPRQKSAELKVVRNLPTLAMEEVAPTAASHATLLAPAEVVDKKKGELMASEEKTDTDKKRERREKKARKSAARKSRERKEALVEKMRPGLGNKYSKEKAMRRLEEAERQGKVVKVGAGEKDKAIKSSAAFFSSLDDEVKSGAREKEQMKKKKNSQKHVNVASLKL